MTLQQDSIKWAAEFINRHSDGDIFPPIPEFSTIVASPDGLIDELTKSKVGDFAPQPCRRFIVPKDELSYRQATQLHPQDSLILTAIIYQYGAGIESRRLPDDTVFSYRFDPGVEYGLYNTGGNWNDFWSTAAEKSDDYSYVLYCDISDFYNQISHHAVENQLDQAKFQNQAIKWIDQLLKSTTQGVSRGIPIGPHGAHLLAECTMIPIDNSLRDSGVVFLRYSDDMVFFCDSKTDARRILHTVASTLDRQQRLLIQQYKTRIFRADEFQEYCSQMVQDRPISEEEDSLLNVISRYSGGNPYASVTYNQISPEDWKQFSEEIVTRIIKEYLQAEKTDYIRLRWFFRRLAQVGHHGGLNPVIENIELLEPCLPTICSYISSIQQIPDTVWASIGARLLEMLDNEPILDTEFARLSILSLFSRNEHIDHFASLAQRFNRADGHTRREILLAAKINGAADWLREHKENYNTMDPWQQMAFVYCSSILPRDERRFFLGMQSSSCPYEGQLMKLSRDST